MKLWLRSLKEKIKVVFLVDLSRVGELKSGIKEFRKVTINWARAVGYKNGSSKHRGMEEIIAAA